jgi:capsule polysaccharide modification protein KpsS
MSKGLQSYYDVSDYKKPNLLAKAKNSFKTIYYQFLYRRRGYLNSHIDRVLGISLSKIRSYICERSIPMVSLDTLKTMKYAYFPLHVEPELNLLLLAPYFNNQLHIIRNLAMSLPSDTVLAVKEHPLTRGAFPMEFYKSIYEMPNVVMISSKENQGDVIENSLFVAVISGTTGIEALMYGKKVITFGDVFFNICNAVEKITDWSDLRNAVKNAINQPVNENDIVSFLQAIIDRSILLDILSIGRVEVEGNSDSSEEKISTFLNKTIKK